MKKIYVIYHSNCYDGFGSAWAAYKTLGKPNENLEYIPMGYANEWDFDRFEKDSLIFFVDFSAKPEVMDELSKGRMVIVLDHHKTAEENLKKYSTLEDLFEYGMGDGAVPCWGHLQNALDKGFKRSASERLLEGDSIRFEMFSDLFRANKSGNVLCYGVFVDFDMERSGAMMTWEFFNHTHEAPNLIRYIQDRDLWKFELEGSREFSAYLRTFEFDFNEWDMIEAKTYNPDSFIRHGEVCLRQDELSVAMITKRAVMSNYNGVKIAYCNTSSHWSEVGEALQKKFPTADMALSFTILPEYKSFMVSLRSTGDKFDVSKWALDNFGGGGHKNAAGCNLDYLEGINLIRDLFSNHLSETIL